MIKNALLSLKKNIGKTILLFVIIVVITNLVIAGLSIQSATQKSMDQIRSSLGNDVTLSVDFRNMMKNREPGAAVSNETSLTTTMADSLKNLKYVESYNYQISTSADSDSISAVENKSDNSNNQQDTNKPNDQPEQASNQGDFTISANTTMEYLDSFTNSNYTLTDGRLLTSDDANTNNCVIETNLASDNDLSVGDTFTITTTVNDETIIQELTIVGIYEIQSTNEIGAAHFNNPVNTIYTDLSVGQTLTGSSENITSAIYYLDDPENAEAFVELAKKKSDIDFDTFSLDANDRLYQQNASSLESMQSFAKMFVWIVVIAGSAILCLILALTIRNRYYEIGVLLSLGQSKVKIVAQQLIEIGLIAVVAFVISLGTGQLTSHYMGNMLESGSSSNVMQMDQKGDQPNDNQQKTNTQTKENFLGNMMEGPSNQELDVSIILDQNYRSTGNILKVSNNLIRKNSQRLEKNLFTKQTGGEDVIHHVAKSEEEEANWIANKIEDIVNNQDGVNYRDIAILYRANYLSRTIEQVLIRKGIDYRIFGGLKFFNRKEVKDALSYLRLVCNQEDLAFERIINTPARGIGKKTLENIQLVALNHQISLYDALTLHSDEIRLSNKSKKEVRILVEAIEKARRSTLPLHEMFENLMIDVGYIEMLKNDLEDNRIDNIHELQRSIYDFQVSHEDAPTLENYLQDISLYTDNDAIDQGQYVSLMSIHMAKGLEFDYVFVLGLSEGIFPSFRSLSEDGDDGLEEERRLAYVAFTRARKQLFLTDSEGFSFVTDSPKISSRFIDEVGNEGIIHSGSKPRFKTTDYVPKQTVSKAELIGDNKVDDWKVGDLVNHDIFGKGVVVKVNKNILDIAFELPAGLKSLMANHKALKKLTN